MGPCLLWDHNQEPREGGREGGREGMKEKKRNTFKIFNEYVLQHNELLVQDQTHQ